MGDLALRNEGVHFVLQFNDMHECFERVFCELKWRKEVILNGFCIRFFSSGFLPEVLASVLIPVAI